MFFELDDVQRRHNPTWWTNNVTAWHTAVDSTPSWNFQRGNPTNIQVSPSDSSQEPCNNTLITSSTIHEQCYSTTSHPQITPNGLASSNIPEISSPLGRDSRAECSSAPSQVFSLSPLSWHSSDSSTQAGLPTSVVSSTATTEKYPLSVQQPF